MLLILFQNSDEMIVYAGILKIYFLTEALYTQVLFVPCVMRSACQNCRSRLAKFVSVPCSTKTSSVQTSASI